MEFFLNYEPVHTSPWARLIGPANHTYRHLPGDRPAKIDTYNLHGRRVAPIAKYEQALCDLHFGSLVMVVHF